MTVRLDLARVTTATTGAGTVTLGPALDDAWLSFADAGVPNGTYVYEIIDPAGGREVGIGRLTGTTLTRTPPSCDDDGPMTLSGGAIVLLPGAGGPGLAAIGAPAALTIAGVVNLFRNGGPDIWQRGPSGTVAPGASVYTADGWIVGGAGAAIAWSRAAGRGRTAYALQITGAIGVTDAFVRQRLDGFLCAPLAGVGVTVQAKFYNGSGVAIVPSLTVRHAGSLDDWGAGAVDVAAVPLQSCPAAAWSTLAYTFVPPAGGANGLELTFDFGAALNSALKSVAVCELDVRLTNAAPGLAAVVSAPELRAMVIELPRCQKYFVTTYADAAPGTATHAGMVGNPYTGTSGSFDADSQSFPVPMRAVPVLAFWDGAGTPNACSGYSFVPDDDLWEWGDGNPGVHPDSISAIGFIAGRNGPGLYHYTASAEL